ncbi:hypothetical protein AALA82_18775 [Oscillospiraceae bacterium 50-16]
MKISILELGIKVILQEQRETLADSLLAEDIDVECGEWDHEKVVRNAKRSMDILLAQAERESGPYLHVILDGFKKGDYLSTMAYIYIVSECNYHFPPYGIIQHAIDDRLLEEYCLALQNELLAAMESDI